MQATSCSDASRMSGGDYDGETVVVIGSQDIVRKQKRDPPPATPDPLRGKFHTVNLHSLVSSGDCDLALDSAFQDACLVMLRDAKTHCAFVRIPPRAQALSKC